GIPGTPVIQITNLSPAVSSEQMRTLFGFLGEIEELRLYPPDNAPLPFSSKVCYIKYREPSSVGVAQHLTNTVFIDRALIVVPCAEGKIPEEAKALSLLAPATTVASLIPGAGLLPIPTPAPIPSLGIPIGNLGALQAGLDPTVAALGGIPAQPPLMGNVDPSKIDEIRRTIYVGNLNSQTTTAEQLLEYFKQVGDVKFVRMAGDETQPTRFAFVEFSDQESVPRALAFNGVMFGDRPLKINHSNNAIVKPPELTPQAAAKELEDVMKRVREAQSFISAVIEPESGKSSSTGSKKAAKSRTRSRSHSRSRRKRSRSRHRSRASRRSRSKVRESHGSWSSHKKHSRSRERRHSRSRSRSRKSEQKQAAISTSLCENYVVPWAHQQNTDDGRFPLERSQAPTQDSTLWKEPVKCSYSLRDCTITSFLYNSHFAFSERKKEKESKSKGKEESSKDKEERRQKDKKGKTPPKSYTSSRRSRSPSSRTHRKRSRSRSKSLKRSRTPKRKVKSPSPRSRSKKDKKKERVRERSRERGERERSTSKKKPSKDKEKQEKAVTPIKVDKHSDKEEKEYEGGKDSIKARSGDQAKIQHNGSYSKHEGNPPVKTEAA
uniref:Splicing regulatory glutamine/lysine-rich protein 1 n=1 Tax=Lepisosteus oculatus TaxID=7918 RepID=W5MX15_LEPOC